VDRQIKWRYFRFDKIQDGGSAAILKNSNGDISTADHLIHSVFRSSSVFGVGGSNVAIFSWTKFKQGWVGKT